MIKNTSISDVEVTRGGPSVIDQSQANKYEASHSNPQLQQQQHAENGYYNYGSGNNNKDDTASTNGPNDDGWDLVQDARPILPRVAFFLGDLRDGLPMLNMQAVFLICAKNYTEKQVGLLFLVFGLSQFLCMAPAGYILDYSNHKIRWVIWASVLCSILTVITPLTAQMGGTHMRYMILWKVLQGALTAIIPPGFNGITMGIVGSTGFTYQVSRNRMMNHLGSSIVVVLGSMIAYLLYPNISALFLVSPLAAMGVWMNLNRIIPTHVHRDAARALIIHSPTMLSMSEYYDDIMADDIANCKQQAAMIAFGEPLQSMNHNTTTGSHIDDHYRYHSHLVEKYNIMPDQYNQHLFKANALATSTGVSEFTFLPPPSEVTGPRSSNYSSNPSVVTTSASPWQRQSSTTEPVTTTSGSYQPPNSGVNSSTQVPQLADALDPPSYSTQTFPSQAKPLQLKDDSINQTAKEPKPSSDNMHASECTIVRDVINVSSSDSFPSFKAVTSSSSYNATDSDAAEATSLSMHQQQQPPPPQRPRKPLSVLKNPILLLFMLCIFLFHVANSSVLPLVMQSLSLQDIQSGILLSGLAIFIAQSGSAFFAKACGDYSPYWGRKNLILLGFISLTLRCFLLTFLVSAEQAVATAHQSYILKSLIVSTQLLDSVGAGIVGTLQVLISADLAGGTGRFSFVLGCTIASMCLGATISGYLGQELAQDYSYPFAFAVLGILSLFPLVLYTVCMPETLPDYVRPKKQLEKNQHRRRLREMWLRLNEQRRHLVQSQNNPFRRRAKFDIHGGEEDLLDKAQSKTIVSSREHVDIHQQYTQPQALSAVVEEASIPVLHSQVELV